MANQAKSNEPEYYAFTSDGAEAFPTAQRAALHGVAKMKVKDLRVGFGANGAGKVRWQRIEELHQAIAKLI